MTSRLLLAAIVFPNFFLIYTGFCSAENTKQDKTPDYRGWKYLVERLVDQGLPEKEVAPIYLSPVMPRFTFIPFAVAPLEHKSIYSGFLNPRVLMAGNDFMESHKREFDRIEKSLHVPREFVTAILLVESHLGRATGKDIVVYRLSRLASAAEPENVKKNYVRLKKSDPNVELEQVEARALKLQKTFLPEIPSLLKIGKRYKFDVLSVRGSGAGAFGWPQFLPSAFLRFGFDGNADGVVSLFNETDAIWSAANYLAHFGFTDELSADEKKKILWRYNHSDAYIETIMEIARYLGEQR